MMRSQQLLQKLPDYDLLFSPLPGAAQVLAPRLLAAFGEDRQRYPQAAALHKGATRWQPKSGRWADRMSKGR